MANPEHVEIVLRGADAIREWREKNPGVQLDLSAARLVGSKLSEADLSEADLGMADLSGTDLRKATLIVANLVSQD